MTNNSNAYIKSVAKGVTPAMRYEYGTDFDAWREGAKAKLEELLGLPLEKCDDCFTVTAEVECDGYKRIEFDFQSEKDYIAKAAILIPNGLTEKKPCVICLQGHSTGMHISLGIPKFPNDEGAIAGGRDFAVRAVKEGVVAVTLEQRYMGSAGQNEKGRASCLDAMSMSALLFGRTPIGERVWDIQRLIDVIFAHFGEYVDTEKLICLGNSGGGTATFYASCLEDRIKISVPSCAVCTFDASIVAMHHCACNYVPTIRKYFDMCDIGALIAPKKFLMVSGQNDIIFPIEPAKATFEQIKGIYKMLGIEENCNMVIGDKGHQFYPDEAWPLIHKYIEEL